MMRISMMALLAVGLIACSDEGDKKAQEGTADASSVASAAVEAGTADQATAAVESVSGWQERVIGQADAPVTIIEFASLGCVHCANFHTQVLPAIKEKYIDTGAVRVIYRDFPLDGLSLNAAQMARCMAEDAYFPFVSLLFTQRDTWLNPESSIDGLRSLAKESGMTDDQITQCLQNQDLLDTVLAKRLEASNEYKIEATPTLFINGQKYTGILSVEDLSAAIDAVIQPAPAQAE